MLLLLVGSAPLHTIGHLLEQAGQRHAARTRARTHTETLSGLLRRGSMARELCTRARTHTHDYSKTCLPANAAHADARKSTRNGRGRLGQRVDEGAKGGL